MLTIILGIIALILGLTLGAISLVAIIGAHKQHKRCSAFAAGIVCEIRVSEQTHKKTVLRSYTPVFEYTVAGMAYRREAKYPVSRTPFSQHDAVTVRYNPQNPADFFIQEDKQSSTQGSGTLLCMGLLLLVGAAVAFFL